MKCERCDKLDGDVGEITLYEEHDCNMELCKDCIAIIEKPYNERCVNCEKLVLQNGGAKKHETQIFCLYCYQNLLASKDKKLKPKTSIVKKGKFWFSMGLLMVGILILMEYV